MAGRRGCHVAIAILQNDFDSFSNLQAFNAYSYVQNNPLSFTDPSGYFLSGLFKAIGNFFKSVFKAILNSQIGRALIQIAACAVAIPACIAAAGGMALAAGGSIVDAIKSMAIGTWSVVGSVLEQAVNLATVAGQAISTVTHAVVGGALSVAQGGSFLEGFASAGLGSVGGFAGSNLVGNSPDGFFVRTALAATAGGIAAEITGGKFANGAITAAFAHLYNDEAHYNCDPGQKCMPGQRPSLLEGGGAVGGSGGGTLTLGDVAAAGFNALRVGINRLAGKAWESLVGSSLERSGLTVGREVTVQTESGVRTRLDFITRDPLTGVVECIECKSSITAPLTRNQGSAFPEIGESGGTIMGAGKPGFPGGTQIPAGPVRIIRPE